MPKANKGGMTANIMFFATALIWGFAFAAQRRGADYLTPFYFNTIRYILGGFSLIPVVLIFERKGTSKIKKTLIYGAITGLVLFCASTLQQFGVAFMENDSKAYT